MDRRYLFVTGCPRSGTTALWQLLTSHPEIALGLERYHGRVGALDQSLFERERFFRIEPGDTFYDDLEAFQPRYAEMRERWDHAAYRGDKIPMLFKGLPQLERVFGPEMRLVVIVRDVYAVAESIQRRHDDPLDTSWPDEDDYRAAVRYWNESLTAILDRLASPAAIRTMPVSFERLFLQARDLKALFAFLELPVSAEVSDDYARTLRRSADLVRERVPVLGPTERAYVTEHARFDLYEQVIAAADHA